MKTSLPPLATSILLLASSMLLQVKAEESVLFGVFKDDQCTDTLMPGSEVAVRELPDQLDGCQTHSYIDPEGELFTNSETMFNCCENFVEFVQYAGSEDCSGGKLIYNVMTIDCDPVDTHMGITYQRLVNYARCSQTHYYNGAFGSTITPEQCNDPNFVPVGGNWVIDVDTAGETPMPAPTGVITGQGEPTETSQPASSYSRVSRGGSYLRGRGLARTKQTAGPRKRGLARTKQMASAVSTRRRLPRSKHTCHYWGGEDRDCYKNY